LINLGAADGYYAIGSLVAKLFKKTYCYEISTSSQKNIIENAKLNKVSNNVEVFGIATHKFANELINRGVNLSKSVVICDIEGSEFALFTKEVLAMLKRSIVIIEIHDWQKNGAKKLSKLRENAKRYFNISEIITGSRDSNNFKELALLRNSDKWLICSENRQFGQKWLKLEPKSQ